MGHGGYDRRIQIYSKADKMMDNGKLIVKKHENKKITYCLSKLADLIIGLPTMIFPSRAETVCSRLMVTMHLVKIL